MNPLSAVSSLFGGGLSASSSASGRTGDSQVGTEFGFANNAPFAVGPGANATASSGATSSTAMWIAIALIGAVVAYKAIK